MTAIISGVPIFLSFFFFAVFSGSDCYLQMSCLMTKPTKWHVRPGKIQISLGILSFWSESSLSAWRKLRSLATHWAHSEDSDRTGHIPRLIWVFAGRTVILLVLSWGRSNRYYLSLFSLTHGLCRFNVTIWQNQPNDCMPCKDSDQPVHPPSLIRVFAVYSRS